MEGSQEVCRHEQIMREGLAAVSMVISSVNVAEGVRPICPMTSTHSRLAYYYDFKDEGLAIHLCESVTIPAKSKHLVKVYSPVGGLFSISTHWPTPHKQTVMAANGIIETFSFPFFQ